jgi:hypothetical protein
MRSSSKRTSTRSSSRLQCAQRATAEKVCESDAGKGRDAVAVKPPDHQSMRNRCKGKEPDFCRLTTHRYSRLTRPAKDPLAMEEIWFPDRNLCTEAMREKQHEEKNKPKDTHRVLNAVKRAKTPAGISVMFL